MYARLVTTYVKKDKMDEVLKCFEESGYFQRQVEKFTDVVTETPVKEEYDVTLVLSKPR